MNQLQLSPEITQLVQLLQQSQQLPQEDSQPNHDNIIRPSEIKPRTKEQKPLSTGTILDLLTLTDDQQNSLGGLPDGTTIIFSGPPGSGKTRTALNSLISVAQHTKSLLVVGEETYTVDNGRDDLHSRIIKLSQKLNIDYDKIKENYVVIENLFHKNQRWEDFFATYEYLITEEGIKYVVIDSLTSLDPYNRYVAQNLNQLKTFNAEHGITCLIISQIKDNNDPQGGNQLMHTADVVFHIEDLYLSNKDVMKEWSQDPKNGKYIRVIAPIKSVTTPITPNKIRVAQSPETGVLMIHRDHPINEMKIFLPKEINKEQEILFDY